MDLICEADGNKSAFSIIPAFVLHDQHGTFKNHGCKREVKTALAVIDIALFPIPCESHFTTIQMYIQCVKKKMRAPTRQSGTKKNVSGCELQATWTYYGKTGQNRCRLGQVIRSGLPFPVPLDRLAGQFRRDALRTGVNIIADPLGSG